MQEHEFKEGDLIVRIKNDMPYAPIGYQTRVIPSNHQDHGDPCYVDLDGDVTRISPEYWKLVEETFTPKLFNYAGT